jgi:hypothetical protein
VAAAKVIMLGVVLGCIGGLLRMCGWLGLALGEWSGWFFGAGVCMRAGVVAAVGAAVGFGAGLAVRGQPNRVRSMVFQALKSRSRLGV